MNNKWYHFTKNNYFPKNLKEKYRFMSLQMFLMFGLGEDNWICTLTFAFCLVLYHISHNAWEIPLNKNKKKRQIRSQYCHNKCFPLWLPEKILGTPRGPWTTLWEPLLWLQLHTTSYVISGPIYHSDWLWDLAQWLDWLPQP